MMMNNKNNSSNDCNSYLQQSECIALAAAECTQNYGNLLNNHAYYNGNYCPPIFDQIMCWPATKAATSVQQRCPPYVAGFDQITNHASKQCMENGYWYINAKTNKHWTNYSQCYTSLTFTVTDTIPTINATLIEEYMPIIKYIARTGYFVSLSTLIVAFCILFYFKKLHCARNKLHMHLFASFIFRATMFFLKDFLFIEGVGMSSDLQMKNGRKYFVEQRESKNWQCKMFTSIWQYFITANYSWILMEGLYLHNLILLALFSESGNSIRWYIILGWGLPAAVIAVYVTARLSLDDNLCWTTYTNPYTFLIIRIPTMISNLINFVLFINIARVLLLKLRSPINEETRLFKRWARSTLVLVPLFGVHYALFIGMSYSMGIDETVELIWLFCDQLFASFQGFFVAILYCFLNGEVRTELRPHLNYIISLCLSAPFSVCNCGDLSRSTTGRPSVCTTLSCSSLYNSNVNQKYSGRKNRWDYNGMKSKQANIAESHICQIHENYPNLIQCDSTLNCCCSTKTTNTQLKDTRVVTEHTTFVSTSNKCHLPSNEYSTDLEMITLSSHHD